MQTPKETHWEAAQRVWFFERSHGQGIMLNSSKYMSVTIYSDSDWSSYPVTRRSLSVFVVFLGDSPIFGRQRSKVQCPILLLKLNMELCLML